MGFIFNNVEVTDADLLDEKPDINAFYLYRDQSNWDSEIKVAEEQVFNEILNMERPKIEGTEADIRTAVAGLEDLQPDEPVYRSIIFRTFAYIFAARGDKEMAAFYNAIANEINLAYELPEGTYNVTPKPETFSRA